MRKKSLIFVSLTLCLAIVMSACGKRPVDNTVKENTATATAPEVKNDTPKEEVKTETPKEEPKKEEPKKEEVKKEVAPVAEKKTATATTNNTSKPAEQPKQSIAAPATTTTTDPQPPVIKDEFHTLLETALPNNGKFKISFDKNQGPVPQNVNYTIDIPSNRSFYKKLAAYALQNDKAISINSNLSPIDDASGNTVKLKGSIVIPQYNNMSSMVDCYVIIVASDDGKTYYEKITYTITQ